MMKTMITTFVMLLTIVTFLIFILTPLPGGAMMFAGSLVLLICTSEWAANKLRMLRARFKLLNKGIVWLEDKMGEKLGGILRTTRPDTDPDSKQEAIPKHE
jgi:hypothetical protein